jgi:putative polyhydroxyalkanoate system protein
MATIHIKCAHALGKQAARSSAEAIAQQLKNELQASYNWKGDYLEFSCPGASGCIRVSDASVEVEVDLSFLLRPLKGKIEREIEQQLQKLLV